MVDIGGAASGESTRRKMEPFVDSTEEVVPLEMYDSFRSKIAANLQWIFAKAYGVDNVPEELKEPFYIDQYEQEHIKPPVIKLLLSSELYCRVCGLILTGDQVAALQGHQPVIEALSQKGIYVMESEDAPVSEADLSCAPIKMSAHMSMIDALMMAYTVEMISIEKVVASVKRFSTFSASKELPYDLEDAMVFWINKVNLKMREILEKEQRLKQQIIESPSHQKVRYRRDHPSNRHLPYFPILEDLLKDISDGAALLTVIHFYCPEQMKLDDICLKEVPSMADNLYNIQLLKEFSSEYLNKCFYLTMEDMLYSPPVLKPNFMVFIAELFWWFENVKPDFVQPRDTQESKEAKLVLSHKSSRPQIPISNATKRSFMASPSTAVDSHSETRSYLQPEDPENGKGSTPFSPSHPLLPLRQKQQKTVHSDDSPSHRDCANSLTQNEVPPRSSVVAWAEKRPRPLSQPPFALHCADDVDATSGDSISLARSISKDSLASNIINATPKHQLPNSSAPFSSRSLLEHVDIEDEEEELVAYIRSGDSSNHGDLELQSISSRASSQQATARSPRRPQPDEENMGGFFLEPLMPAVLKKAKEKQMVHKREEYGESKPKGFVHRRESEGTTQSFPRKKITTNHTAHNLNRTYTPVCSSELSATESPRIEPLQASIESGTGPFRPLATSSIDPSVEPSSGFFLHDSKSDMGDEEKLTQLSLDIVKDPESTWTLSRQDSDSDNLDLEEECDQELLPPHPVCKYIGEEESAKLQEDMKVKENDDKDDASGRSSPCLSTISQVSSVSLASGSVRMTSFAERKFQRLNSYETKSSTSSSQKTTPDGSECCLPPLTTWKQRREQSPGGQNKDHTNVLASELVQLHMQLEEKRRAIEAQKKKMESLSARQRLKLGKAAFLNVVKKSKHEGSSHPLRIEHPLKDFTKQTEADMVTITSKAEQVLEKAVLPSEVSKQPKVQEILEQKPKELDLDEVEVCNVVADASPDDADSEVDVTECNLSIEKLNETISTLQQAILKISQQQELLMKAPASVLPALKTNSQDLKLNPPVHFVEPLSPPGTGTGARKNRFGQGRNPRSSRASEHKMFKEKMHNSTRVITPTQSIETLPHLKSVPALKSPIHPTGDGSDKSAEQSEGHPDNPTGAFRLHEENNQRTFVLSTSKDANILSDQAYKDVVNSSRAACVGSSESSGKENVPVDERLKNKSSLIEVDLSELIDPDEEVGTDNPENSTDAIGEDQKSGVGFFFKDDQKAEDELAKRRAAFLLKQQRKAEEARLRKLQLEAEVELKRDEARRKAEEDRIRKDEEKARRELIKQEYLRRKQQQILEEQGLGRPKPKPKKSRPKSVHREESYSDSGTKYSSTPDNLSSAQSGSSLSLASGATTEAESVHSGGTPSHRVDSVETLSLGSRHQSRTAERDWENASTASSIASVAEYSGPKLYKEPSSKSNKPIIHNAIAHCCLAGKVNESLKNQTLDELEKCDANHFIILFRDAGCQFRSLYSYFPDSEEICKLTGTGPKSISKKMIDKLYKYSSDRKQFTVIPAKTMSVSVDALTIHNHLWQAKRPALPKKTNPLYK